MMTRHEKIAFDKLIRKANCYLEFGVGGSTLRALQKSKARIYVVESSIRWVNNMRKYRIFRRAEDTQVYVTLVDIGPTKGFGHPISDENKHLFELYPTKIFESIDKKAIDLVLVDGRFRVACALYTILSCHENENLTILIHDFWSCEWLQVMLRYLDVEQKVDDLGIFTIKNDVDLESVKKDFEEYKFDSR